MATTHTYNPQTHTTVTWTQETYTVPTGPAPVPLPTSHNYVRPVKQHQGLGAKLGSAWNKMTNKAQRCMLTIQIYPSHRFHPSFVRFEFF